MMDEYGWSAWYVEYNPASDMFDVYSRRKEKLGYTARGARRLWPRMSQRG